jgi:predicted DCC family thiol-disulfide oxidoreductase YuxK
VIYHARCPLCGREIATLERLDRGRGRIQFRDLWEEGLPAGLDREAALDRIHAVLPDGTLIEGMEVFRRAYAAVGLGWLLAATAWPLLRPLADAAYALFARNRLWLTGRAGEATCRIGPPDAAHGHANTASEPSERASGPRGRRDIPSPDAPQPTT